VWYQHELWINYFFYIINFVIIQIAANIIVYIHPFFMWSKLNLVIIFNVLIKWKKWWKLWKDVTTGNNVFIVSVIIKSKCRILQFLYQMFIVFALLLDDALLKRVVTEVVLFSILAFKTLTCFHTQRRTWGVVGSLWEYYYKCSPDSDSDISLKIGHYLTKLRRRNKVCQFFWATL